MRKSFLLLLMAMIMVHGLEESLTSMSLEQLNSLDTSQYDCTRPQSEFIQMENSLSQWQDLLEHKQYIDHDLKVLEGIQVKVGVKASHKSVLKSLSQLQLPKTSTKIGLAEVQALKEQCGCLKHSDNDCDALLKLLSYFILSLRNVQSQCQQHPITVIKIKGKIHDLQVIRAGCGGTIDIHDGEACDTPTDVPATDEPAGPTINEPATDPAKPAVDEPTKPADVTEEGTGDEPTPDDQKDTAGEEATEESAEESTTATQEETTNPEEGEQTTSPEEEGTTQTDQPAAEEEEGEGEGELEYGESPSGESAITEEEGEGAESEGETETEGETAAEGEEAQTEAEGEAEGAETSAEGETEGEQASETEGEQVGETEGEQAGEEEEQAGEEGEQAGGEGEQAGEEGEQAGEEGETAVNAQGEAEEGEATPEEESISDADITEPTEEIDIEVPAEEEAVEEEECDEEEEEGEQAGELGAEEAGETGEAGESGEAEGAEESTGGEEAEGETAVDHPSAEEGEQAGEEESIEPAEEGENAEGPSEEGEGEGVSPAEEGEASAEEGEEAAVGDEPTPDDEKNEEQEVLPEGCRKVPEDVLDVSWENTAPISVSDLPVTDSGIIGLSFYFRWLSKFPVPVPEGLDQETKFFVAGLGDALKFYVGKGGFHFSSFDENGAETFKNAGHGDIEGQWVLIYFGVQNGQVTGFAQIDGGDVEIVEFDVNLTLEETYQLSIGGVDGEVKSFNGQIARVFAFNDELYTDAASFTQFVTNCYGIPKNIYSGKRLTIPIEKERTFVSTATFDQDSVFENQKPMLPDEYSASGWFKWEVPQDQNIWHAGFRWTTNDQTINENFRNLGDRGLTFFIGDEEHLQGHVAYCTYSYKNNNGKPKVNDCKMVKYGEKLTEWFYVYFGYSRHLNKAYGYMEFTHDMAQMEFNGVRHYQAAKTYFYLGQDKFYPPFNGKVQGFMLNFFDGSYRTSSYDYTFGYFPRPVYEYDDSKELIPSEPIVKKKCPKVYEITVENAAEVICALSNYLSAVAAGHDPSADPKAETFCFCLVYEEENASPDLLMLAQIFGGRMKPKSNGNSSIKRLINKQKALVK